MWSRLTPMVAVKTNERTKIDFRLKNVIPFLWLTSFLISEAPEEPKVLLPESSVNFVGLMAIVEPPAAKGEHFFCSAQLASTPAFVHRSDMRQGVLSLADVEIQESVNVYDTDSCCGVDKSSVSAGSRD